MKTIDESDAWGAFERRDRSWDGRVIGAVRTTGVYCKPSCPARRPRRENVEFFVDAEAARAAGYRPCLRCRPELAPGDDSWRRGDAVVARALKLIEVVRTLEQLSRRIAEQKPQHGCRPDLPQQRVDHEMRGNSCPKGSERTIRQDTTT